MFPRTLHTSLALFPFVITLVHCSSIEFFVDQTFDECSRNSQTVACANNTDRGGLCAYAPDTRKLWCCPAPNPTCWSYGQDCNGGSSAAPGPGQISCSSQGARWCCDQQYEACTQVKDAINVCETVFGSGNANVSIAEANAVESSSTSTTSSTILLSSYSGILSSRANAGSTSTTSATSSTATFTPRPLASPGTSSHSSALSPGAIAGIVIGVVLAISLGFLICWNIIRARRRQPHKAQPIDKNLIPEMDNDAAKAELDGRRPRREMPGHDMRPEMDDQAARMELDGRRPATEILGHAIRPEMDDQAAKAEFDGTRSAWEMPGHDARYEMR